MIDLPTVPSGAQVTEADLAALRELLPAGSRLWVLSPEEEARYELRALYAGKRGRRKTRMLQLSAQYLKCI